jgi:glycosyltransferase involved in cell wall biosynthesis
MRVLLVGNFVPDGQYSMLGFTRALAAGLPSENVTVEVVSPRPIASRGCRSTHGGAGKWLGYLDKFALFLPRLRRAARRADLIHICDQGNSLYVRPLADLGRPILLNCHDLFAVRAGMGDPELWPLSHSGQYFQGRIWRGIQSAQNIVCISEATRRDLHRLLEAGNTVPGPQKRRIACIPHALQTAYLPLDTSHRHALIARHCDRNPEDPYLFHVGGNQPYKNRMGLLKIYEALNRRMPSCPALLLAGRPMTPEMRQYLTENHLEERVQVFTGLEDECLRALYSQASALIYPSTREGFGIPVLEAQACGCPVFTSNRAPMTEGGGDAAIYFDPDDPETAAEIIAPHLQDREALAAMSRRGLANIAAHFTTERMVAQYRDLYETILSGK